MNFGRTNKIVYLRRSLREFSLFPKIVEKMASLNAYLWLCSIIFFFSIFCLAVVRLIDLYVLKKSNKNCFDSIYTASNIQNNYIAVEVHPCLLFRNTLIVHVSHRLCTTHEQVSSHRLSKGTGTFKHGYFNSFLDLPPSYDQVVIGINVAPAPATVPVHAPIPPSVVPQHTRDK